MIEGVTTATLHSEEPFPKSLWSLRVEIFHKTWDICSYAQFLWKLFISQFPIHQLGREEQTRPRLSPRWVYKVRFLAQAENWLSWSSEGACRPIQQHKKPFVCREKSRFNMKIGSRQYASKTRLVNKLLAGPSPACVPLSHSLPFLSCVTRMEKVERQAGTFVLTLEEWTKTGHTSYTIK